MITFITGGVKSGKSSFALSLAPKNENKIFIATLEPFDDHMLRKVEIHKNERWGLGYTTIEEPLELGKAIKDAAHKTHFIIIDCLTIWVNNLIYNLQKHAQAEANSKTETGADALNVDFIQKPLRELLESLGGVKADVVLVSNETGWGIIPENATARIYSEALGIVNRQIAQIADRVFCVVSGIPVQIKQPV